MSTGLLHSRGTILVASTESTVRGHLRSVLTAWGFKVLETSGSAAAVDIVGRLDIQLVLLDPRVDAEGGADLATVLIDRSPRVRIVVVDHYDGDVQLSGDAAARMVGSIGRPLSARKLDRVIETVFGDL